MPEARPQLRSLTLAGGRLLTPTRPLLMAICNTTPDSFYEPSRAKGQQAADAMLRAIDEGADILDIGAESTRPGASRVDADEQIRRAIPVIESLRKNPASQHIPISIDTTLAPVARAALEAGADIINDVAAATESPDMLNLAANAECGIILMHRATPPDQDRYSHQYDTPPIPTDPVATVHDFLSERINTARDFGVTDEQIILDPGLGFGKTPEQNWQLIVKSRDFISFGMPLVSALSRKSFVGAAQRETDDDPLPPPEERLEATIALSTLHLVAGASIFRVHDVAAHRAALEAAFAVLCTNDIP